MITRALTELDFVTIIDADTHVNGLPLGEDDFFVMYGHVQDLVIINEQIKYWVETHALPRDQTDIDEAREFMLTRGARHIWARPIAEDENSDWILTWQDMTAHDEGVIPVTMLDLR